MCRIYFYSRPCGRGDGQQILKVYEAKAISTHAPAGGATAPVPVRSPAGGYFYSRPCGRGDSIVLRFDLKDQISTHAPAGGATGTAQLGGREGSYFYSRPCGRGDLRSGQCKPMQLRFLLTPLREGRLYQLGDHRLMCGISTHAPAGGATCGRCCSSGQNHHFYSRPCGRGDMQCSSKPGENVLISTHAPAGGATGTSASSESPQMLISTHAPAGGATYRKPGRMPSRR